MEFEVLKYIQLITAQKYETLSHKSKKIHIGNVSGKQ